MSKPKEKATGHVDFNAVDSPDHRVWKQHRELLLTVPGVDAGYRGCIGFGLLVDATTHDSWIEVPIGGPSGCRVFVPDETVRWLSLTDIPLGFFQLGEKSREVHWATSRPTMLRYGMPCLARGNGDSWDFRRMPYDTIKVTTQGGDAVEVNAAPDILSPTRQPQLFRAFNAIEWSMTSTAFMFRRTWQKKRQALYDAVGVPYDADKKLLLFGEDHWDRVERPEAWMPRAYLAFPEELRERLFDRATRPAAVHAPVYAPSFQAAFLRALEDELTYYAPFSGMVRSVKRTMLTGQSVITLQLAGDLGESARVSFSSQSRLFVDRNRRFHAGEAIGCEKLKLPAGWEDKSPRVKWDRWLPRLVGNFDVFLRIWFDRQAVALVPGLIHLPSELSAPAALGNALDASLFWDVSPSMPYFRQDCDTFVFPTLQVSKWDAFRGSLPGEIAYDFTPGDRRFVDPVQAKKAKVERGEARRKAAEGNKVEAKKRQSQSSEVQRCTVRPVAPKADDRTLELQAISNNKAEILNRKIRKKKV